MPKFRSKIVEIEARQWDGTFEGGKKIVAEFMGATIENGMVIDTGKGIEFWCHTLEGNLRASEGDWIIKGTEGEFYPCKPSVFDRKYEIA